MNSKSTGIWFTLAAALFVLIYAVQHFLRPAAAESSAILADLSPAAATSLQIIPSGALEIRAERTNDMWLLTKPVVYPAQSAAIEALIEALQKPSPPPASVPPSCVNAIMPMWNMVSNRRAFHSSSNPMTSAGSF